MRISTRRVKSIAGSLRAPSDKSLTHRAYMFSAIANGPSRVRMPLRGEDCESTLICMKELGLAAAASGLDEIVLRPGREWRQPTHDLDCGNSGTTMRLLSGLLASRALSTTLVGDASLSRRPMSRIAEPLREMGAQIEGDRPPLRIHGSAELHGIDYLSPVASAQIKSCILLAGLRAKGPCQVTEPSLSRDHTERMLRAMGARVDSRVNGSHTVRIEPAEDLQPFEISIPADISSAAFFMVAASVLPGGQLTLKDLSVNPTRTGILDVLCQAGVGLELHEERSELGEPVADLAVSAPEALKPFQIAGDLVPRLIDEIPVLCILATQCEGTSTIRDARELRVKESDRIELMADGLRRMGAQVETFEDGMAVTGPTQLRATLVDAHGDHRIAMAFAIGGLIAEGETLIDGAETIATSFPGFTEEVARLVVA